MEGPLSLEEPVDTRGFGELTRGGGEDVLTDLTVEGDAGVVAGKPGEVGGD